MLRTKWYNCFGKGFMGYGVCKIVYWAPKGAKIAAYMQKRPLRGPKSENPLYLINNVSTRPKNWQMIRTKWYNCFRKGFMGYGVCKIGYWMPKGIKIAAKMQKGP